MKNALKVLAAILLLVTGCSTFKQPTNNNITKPIVKNDPPLIYPIEAQKNNIEGNVSVIFIITKEGTVGQTKLFKSSGSKALDLAAENYCKKLEFIPAMENGIPIRSSMRWKVKYNLTDISKIMINKIEAVKRLYSEILMAEETKRQNLEWRVLAIHDDCLKNIKDGQLINEYLYAVVQPKIKEEWTPLTQNLPLTFLLYHDFINRFQDFDSLGIVKAKMKTAVKQDIQTLNQPFDFNSSATENNALIIQKIKKLLEVNYPEINLQDLELKNVTVNNNLSMVL
jgi:TonB family protein